MKGKISSRLRIVIIILIVSISLAAISFNSIANMKNSCRKITVMYKMKYLTHTPIRINSDSDFTSQNGVIGGNGTADNPYIIEGWEIDAHGEGSAIYIGNTTKYFIIRNCKLYNASYLSSPYFDGDGIMLYKVANGKIVNCEIFDNEHNGIYLYISTHNNIISNNNITNNSNHGIYLSSAYRNTIINNNIFNNDDGIYLLNGQHNKITSNNITNNSNNGIFLRKSNSNTISYNNIAYNSNGTYFGYSTYSNIVVNNNITNNNNGIYLARYSADTTIKDNYFANNKYGIHLYYSYNNIINNNSVFNTSAYCIWLWHTDSNTVTNNHITNNNDNGIYLAYSDNNTISGNYIFNNDGDGIYVWASRDNIITNNYIVHNNDYGIYICSIESTNNQIYNNTLIYNHGSDNFFNSSHVQAYDSGNNNKWNTSSGYGNYWHDWANNNDTNDQNGDGIVDWPYSIEGLSCAKDRYPLKNRSFAVTPLPPTNLTANVGNGYVNLTWNAPIDNGGTDIIEYKIYRNETLIATVSALHLWYNDTTVVIGQKYVYYVTAVNSIGESDRSNGVQVTIGSVYEIQAFALISGIINAVLMFRFRKLYNIIFSTASR